MDNLFLLLQQGFLSSDRRDLMAMSHLRMGVRSLVTLHNACLWSLYLFPFASGRSFSDGGWISEDSRISLSVFLLIKLFFFFFKDEYYLVLPLVSVVYCLTFSVTQIQYGFHLVFWALIQSSNWFVSLTSFVPPLP